MTPLTKKYRAKLKAARMKQEAKKRRENGLTYRVCVSVGNYRTVCFIKSLRHSTEA
jgi:hypothetical protein